LPSRLHALLERVHDVDDLGASPLTGCAPLGFFQPQSDTSNSREMGSGMATLLFWSIVLIPVGVFAFWSSLKELSTRKTLTVSFAIWIFAWAAVTAGLATNALSALTMIFW
jgi:hypothetical protein